MSSTTVHTIPYTAQRALQRAYKTNCLAIVDVCCIYIICPPTRFKPLLHRKPCSCFCAARPLNAAVTSWRGAVSAGRGVLDVHMGQRPQIHHLHGRGEDGLPRADKRPPSSPSCCVDLDQRVHECIRMRLNAYVCTHLCMHTNAL